MMKRLMSLVFMALAFAVCMTSVSPINCLAYTNMKSLVYNAEADKFITNWGKPEGENEMSQDDFQRLYTNRPFNNNFRNMIITDEFKYINDIPMVKVRDVIEAMGGKAEYNGTTKIIKAVLSNPRGSYNAIREFTVIPGNKKIDFTIISFAEAQDEVWRDVAPRKKVSLSYECKTTPTRIDNELYVSAEDLEEILGRYYLSDKYPPSSKRSVTHIENDDIYMVRIMNDILYIPLFEYIF